MSIMKIAILLCGALLAGCASDTIQTAKEAEEGVVRSPMPFEDTLACIADTRPRPPFTIAIGDFTDDTGKYVPDGGGKQFPQGLRKMASSALSAAGVLEVARSRDVWRVVAMERDLAKNGHLGGRTLRPALNGSGQPILGKNKRPIMIATRAVNKADILGSTLVLEGSITGFDANLSTGGLEVNVGGFEAGGRSWTGRFYADTALIDTISTRTVAADTFARTIVGSEFKAGVFTFNFGKIISVNAGVVNQEGLALSTRAAVNMTVASLIAQVHPPAMECLLDEFKPRSTWRARYVPGSVAPKSVNMSQSKVSKALKAASDNTSPPSPRPKPIGKKPARRKSVLVTPGIWKPNCFKMCR